MKFSSAALLSGAALASAVVVPRDVVDYCAVKTVTVSWMKTVEFSVAETWTQEQVTSLISKSKPDPAQVYPELNKTMPASSSSSVSSSKPASSSLSASFSSATKSFSNSTATVTAPSFSGSVFPTISGFSASSAATTTTTSSAAAASTTAPSGSGTCSNPAVRVEWRNLSDDQRDAFVAAIKCLIDAPSRSSSTFPGSQNLFEDLASLHQQLTPVVHNNGIFLVWHRYFVHTFETLLRDTCSYAGPLVWWDETIDAGAFTQAPMFTERWFGEMRAATSDGNAVCVGASGFGDYTASIGPDSTIGNMHCLSRAVNEAQTANTGASWVASCQNGAQNYDDFRQCNEFTYHAYGHNGIGAVMANVASSPEDPVFYLHHGYVDHAWKAWQAASPATRNVEVGGTSASGGTVMPTDVLQSFGLLPDATAADVLNTEGGYLCYVYDY